MLDHRPLRFAPNPSTRELVRKWVRRQVGGESLEDRRVLTTWVEQVELLSDFTAPDTEPLTSAAAFATLPVKRPPFADANE